jgi:hypothetical protein
MQKHFISKGEKGMADKSTFTAEEWAVLLKSPGMAGLAIVAADPSGPFGALKESFATGKALAEIKMQGSSNSLIKSVVEDMTTDTGREASRPAEILGMSTEQAKAHALDICKRAAAIADAKAGAEAAEFKSWLVSISQRVAEASKEGGFLGIGGTRVSAEESAAIKEVAGAMGI